MDYQHIILLNKNSKSLEFEEAAKYRDRILKLRNKLLGRSRNK